MRIIEESMTARILFLYVLALSMSAGCAGTLSHSTGKVDHSAQIIPVPQTPEDLGLGEAGGKAIINEGKNVLCYSIRFPGAPVIAGEIGGHDFLAMRSEGREAEIEAIFLARVQEEIVKYNSTIGITSSVSDRSRR